MSDDRQLALQYAHEHYKQFLDSLCDLLKIPSVSTSPEHTRDIQAAANWLAEKLRSLGMARVQVLPTKGHPVVYGEWMNSGSAPTILVYGHYDVQPAEPIELWLTDPFEPDVRGENLYARGASDMKGQIIASLAAIESILRCSQMPVNLKFMLEGEEEIGSPNLRAFMHDHRELLACNLALNPDTGMIALDVPTLTYALRGLAYFEVRVYGPDHDLHSGLFGGVVHNPAQVLCDLISGMHDSQGRITLPGYYDRVREMEPEERTELAYLPMDQDYFKNQAGVKNLWGEAGFTPVERVGARPTLEVNGLLSGFTGQGSKTVLPAWAMAKISMRLVPDQDPQEVYEQLSAYLKSNAPDTVRWEISQFSGGPACMIQRNSHGNHAMAEALEAIWGRRPLFKREGGSVPVVGEIQEILGSDSVLTGFGLPDDNVHGPNEKLHLPTWYKGIDALIHFFYNY